MRKIRFALFALFAFLIVFVTSLTSCGTDDILNPDSYDPDGPIVLEEAFNVNGVKFVMVAVEGGTFMMGATSEQKESYYDENPAHSVTLSGFFIGRHEVTQELWQAVMGNKGRTCRWNASAGTTVRRSSLN